MEISWDEAKNDKLKTERGISFEEIAQELVAGRVLDIVPHPSRPMQKIFVVKIRNLFVMVPFVAESDGVFLKTAYVSRKARKKFGGMND
jgi:uncharacterized DUF497 family protein